jgi:hypothetical protein
MEYMRMAENLLQSNTDDLYNTETSEQAGVLFNEEATEQTGVADTYSIPQYTEQYNIVQTAVDEPVTGNYTTSFDGFSQSFEDEISNESFEENFNENSEEKFVVNDQTDRFKFANIKTDVATDNVDKTYEGADYNYD